MGIRFRQRIKVFPGIHFNLSTRGASVSIGGPGATLNVNKDLRVAATVGLPGTGLSYRHTFRSGPTNHKAPPVRFSALDEPARDLDVSAGSKPELVGAAWTEGPLREVQQLIVEARAERASLESELKALIRSHQVAKERHERLSRWFIRPFRREGYRKSKAELHSTAELVNEVREDLKEQGLKVDWHIEGDIKDRYTKFVDAMRIVARAGAVWHLKGKSKVDRVRERTLFDTALIRLGATLSLLRPDFLSQATGEWINEVPCLASETGVSLYFFPTFILTVCGNEIGLIRPDGLKLDIGELCVVEYDAEAPVPADADIAGHSWRYVNHDGSRDLRFKDNLEVPIVAYQTLNVTAASGLDETFLFSSGVTNFASWVSVVDGLEAADYWQAIAIGSSLPASWRARREGHVQVIAQKLGGSELVAIAFSATSKIAHLFLATEQLGLSMDAETQFHVWLDDRLIINRNPFVGQLDEGSEYQVRFLLEADPEAFDILFQELIASKELLFRIANSEKEPFSSKISMESFRPLIDTPTHEI